MRVLTTENSYSYSYSDLKVPIIRELKQPRRRRQQESHEFAFLTMKNNSFAPFAGAFFILGHFADALDLSTTWNDMFCSCVDDSDASIWWQMFNFVFLPLKRWFEFHFRIFGTHFASVMTKNNWELIAETRSYILKWRSRCRLRRVCLSKLPNREFKIYDATVAKNVAQNCKFKFFNLFRHFVSLFNFWKLAG